jgi:catalase (peroxidase I)
VSIADLIVLAGSAAIEKAGDPKNDWQVGKNSWSTCLLSLGNYQMS